MIQIYASPSRLFPLELIDVSLHAKLVVVPNVQNAGGDHPGIEVHDLSIWTLHDESGRCNVC
jgi:hypothetical protein